MMCEVACVGVQGRPLNCACVVVTNLAWIPFVSTHPTIRSTELASALIAHAHVCVLGPEALDCREHVVGRTRERDKPTRARPASSVAAHTISPTVWPPECHGMCSRPSIGSDGFEQDISASCVCLCPSEISGFVVQRTRVAVTFHSIEEHRWEEWMCPCERNATQLGAFARSSFTDPSLRIWLSYFAFVCVCPAPPDCGGGSNTDQVGVIPYAPQFNRSHRRTALAEWVRSWPPSLPADAGHAAAIRRQLADALKNPPEYLFSDAAFETTNSGSGGGGGDAEHQETTTFSSLSSSSSSSSAFSAPAGLPSLYEDMEFMIRTALDGVRGLKVR